MNNILDKVKMALAIDYSDLSMDAMITSKIEAVKQYLKSAGVPEIKLFSELGTSVIVIGVTDLWNLNAGDIKFSPAFNILISQLSLTGEE